MSTHYPESAYNESPQPPKKSGVKKAAIGCGAVIVLLFMLGSCALMGGLLATAPTAPTSTAPAPAAASATSSVPAPAKQPAATKTTTPVPYASAAAADSAQGYLDMGAFSKKSLTKQLEFEGHEKAAIDYALANVNVDWDAEAVESVGNYQDLGMGMSVAELKNQLEFEGFTASQVAHGIANAPQK